MKIKFKVEFVCVSVDSVPHIYFYWIQKNPSISNSFLDNITVNIYYVSIKLNINIQKNFLGYFALSDQPVDFNKKTKKKTKLKYDYLLGYYFIYSSKFQEHEKYNFDQPQKHNAYVLGMG